MAGKYFAKLLLLCNYPTLSNSIGNALHITVNSILTTIHGVVICVENITMSATRVYNVCYDCKFD